MADREPTSRRQLAPALTLTLNVLRYRRQHRSAPRDEP